jgi:hypothetical protein
MNNEMIITEEPADPELWQDFHLYQRNADWMGEYGKSFYDLYPGQYVAVSQGEVFVSPNAEEARRLAVEKHPDDRPYVQYITLEKYERIYAC